MEDVGLSSLGGGIVVVVVLVDLVSLVVGGSYYGGYGVLGDCLNCGVMLVVNVCFCSQCGQGMINYLLLLLEFVYEFVSYYIVVEGMLWKSLWGLMVWFGFLMCEYFVGCCQWYVLLLCLLLILGLLFFMVLKLMLGSMYILGLEDELDVFGVQVVFEVVLVVLVVFLKMVKVRKKFVECGVDMYIFDLGFVVELFQGMQDCIYCVEVYWCVDFECLLYVMGVIMLGLVFYVVLCFLFFFVGLFKLLFWCQFYGVYFVFVMYLYVVWYGMLLLVVLLFWLSVVFVVWVWFNFYLVIVLKWVYVVGWFIMVLCVGLLVCLYWIILGLGLLVFIMVGVLVGG